jgi:hypothetical protein
MGVINIFKGKMPYFYDNVEKNIKKILKKY